MTDFWSLVARYGGGLAVIAVLLFFLYLYSHKQSTNLGLASLTAGLNEANKRIDAQDHEIQSLKNEVGAERKSREDTETRLETLERRFGYARLYISELLAYIRRHITDISDLPQPHPGMDGEGALLGDLPE